MKETRVGPGFPVKLSKVLLDELPMTLKNLRPNPFIKKTDGDRFLLSFISDEHPKEGQLWIEAYEFEYLPSTKPFNKEDWM